MECTVLQEPTLQPNGKASPWTEERVNLLKQYHADGLSMTLIADQINHATTANFTRNAVIGKALRLGLPQRMSSMAVGGFHKKVRVAGANRDRGMTQRIRRSGDVLAFIEPELPSPDHLAVKFFDLEKHHCRFIKEDSFCGQNVAPESSWCPFHHRLVYQRPTKPVRLAA